MFRRTPAVRVLLSLLALTAGVAGCGDVEDQNADGVGGAAVESDSPVVDSADPTIDERLAAVIEDESIVDPIEVLFGGEYSATPGRAEVEAAEAELSECMAAAGFEYEASDFSTVFEETDEEGHIDPLSREFAVAEGYGIADGFGRSLGENSPTTTIASSDMPVDTAEEQAAYDEALYGGPSAPPGDEGGCQGAAYADLTADLDRYTEHLQTIPIVDLYDEIGLAIASATEDEMQQWSDCMSERGYDFDDPDDAWDSTQARAAQMVEAETGSADSLGALTSEAIDAIRQMEIPIAVDDYDCGEAMRSTADRVRREMSVDFIIEYEAEIVAYLDAVEG